MTALTSTTQVRNVDNLKLVGRQIYYEQLTFWLNPIAALFTIVFSILFMVLIGGSAGNSRKSVIGGVRLIQYYTAGFVAYGVMSTCFNQLSISLVIRREMGLLKRLRLSPLPAWALFLATLGNVVIISVLQIVLLLVIDKFAYHVILPHNWASFVVTLLVGVATFTAIGIAMSTLVPNQEAAGPIVSIVFFVLLFLSGLWYPINSHSGLGQLAAVFPFRHMILAVFAPLDYKPGASSWAWNDVLVMGIWGVGATLVALRRWSWAPRRSDQGIRGPGRFGLFR
jgi:ABC-2 type transport system permease protein